MPLLIEQQTDAEAIANFKMFQEECIYRIKASSYLPKEGDFFKGMTVPLVGTANPDGVRIAREAMQECFVLRKSIVAQEREAEIKMQIGGAVGVVLACVLAYVIYRLKFKKKVDEKAALDTALNTTTLE